MTDTPEKPKMEKPARSWRGFLKEYAIIVVGVLTALAAQQAAEWWNRRSQYEQARESLATELASNAARGAFRVVRFNCNQAKLDRAAILLDEATRSGTLSPVAGIGFAEPRNWPSGAWDSVVGAQVAAYFPREQLARIGLVYEQIRNSNESNRQEEVAWAELSAMVGPGRRFDPALDTALHSALSRARMFNAKLAITGGQIAERAFALDLPFSAADRKLVDDSIAEGRNCLPQGTAVPAYYGANVYQRAEPAIRDMMKSPLYSGKSPP